MKKPTIKNFQHGVKTHLPQIASGAGVGGLLVANFFTALATARSIRKIEAEEKRLGRKLTKKEKFLLCWKFWVAPTASAGSGIAAIVYGNKQNMKEKAALATSLAAEKITREITKSDFDNYVKATEENVDDETRDKIDKDYKKNKNEVLELYPTNYRSSDKIPCFCPTGSILFDASVNEIEAAVNKINSYCNSQPFEVDGPVTWDFFKNFDLTRNGDRPLDSELMYEKGWNLDNPIELKPLDKAIVVDNQPVLLVEFKETSKPKSHENVENKYL